MIIIYYKFQHCCIFKTFHHKILEDKVLTDSGKSEQWLDILRMLTAFLLWNSIVGVSLVVQWFRPCLPAEWVWDPSLVRELRSHMPPGQKVKSSNRSNNVTNYIKTLKTVHIKKKKKKPFKKRMKWYPGYGEKQTLLGGHWWPSG